MLFGLEKETWKENGKCSKRKGKICSACSYMLKLTKVAAENIHVRHQEKHLNSKVSCILMGGMKEAGRSPRSQPLPCPALWLGGLQAWLHTGLLPSPHTAFNRGEKTRRSHQSAKWRAAVVRVLRKAQRTAELRAWAGSGNWEQIGSLPIVLGLQGTEKAAGNQAASLLWLSFPHWRETTWHPI